LQTHKGVVMSHETMIENIKAELEHVDASALESIWEIIDKSKRKPVPSLDFTGSSITRRADKMASKIKPWKFVGENLTLEEYERLSVEERCKLKQRLKEQNHHWLQEKFSAPRTAWLAVIDGEVIASGKTLKDLPLAKQNVEISRRTGKFPFIFINDDFMLIEESGSTWHETNDPGDFYPTLPVTLISASTAIEIIGDFDTGAAQTFANYDFLASRNLIRSEIGDDYDSSRHLSRSFNYVTKPLHFKLFSKSGKTYDLQTNINCVLNWHASPFIKINPQRVALIGRDLLLALKPKVLLDFEKRQTEIVNSMITRQPRKKIKAQKKRTSKSRRRR
jgi:hypothetical protein